MDRITPLPALTQDELRVGAWAEVREPLELQLAPLGRHPRDRKRTGGARFVEDSADTAA